MKIRMTSRGYLGLLVALVAAAAYLMAGSARVPDEPQEGQQPKRFDPTESIDVEQAVDFPYDI